MITIFTDASYCSDIKRGTWAVWAKFDNAETHRNSGVIRPICRSSNIAEVYAICNGFCSALAFFKPPPKTFVLIQSDSTAAISQYDKNTSYECRDAVAAFRERANSFGVRYGFRHVKGHKGNATPRNSVNSSCDRRCYQLLQQLRAELGWQSENIVYLDRHRVEGLF